MSLKLIQILGPTATGKSNISIKLAKDIKGEIISADSIQVYKGLDIGSAKPSIEEQKEVKHHLIDIINIKEQFNASKFLSLSFDATLKIESKNKIPIVCGGTGLYLRTMNMGLFPEPKQKFITREKLKALSKKLGNQRLWQKIMEVDPNYAKKISVSDTVRIIRALEIYYNCKKPPSEIFKKSYSPFKNHKIIRIGLNIKREELYKRINMRVDNMIKNGLEEECRRLKKKGIKGAALNSIGYKEIFTYLNGELSFDDAIDLIKQSTRRFAKRQVTWFKKEKNINWFNHDDYNAIYKYVLKELE